MKKTKALKLNDIVVVNGYEYIVVDVLPNNNYHFKLTTHPFSSHIDEYKEDKSGNVIADATKGE